MKRAPNFYFYFLPCRARISYSRTYVQYDSMREYYSGNEYFIFRGFSDFLAGPGNMKLFGAPLGKVLYCGDIVFMISLVVTFNSRKILLINPPMGWGSKSGNSDAGRKSSNCNIVS
jgi:hypothetical protein